MTVHLRSTASTIGVRFMTTYSDHYEDQDAIALSQREDKMVIVRLPEEEDFTEIKNYLRINQYLRRQTTQSLTPSQQDIRQRKASERKQLEDVFVAKLKQDISEANIIVNGSEIDISGTPEKRIEKGLYSLVSNTYPKIFYIKNLILKMNWKNSLCVEMYPCWKSMKTKIMKLLKRSNVILICKKNATWS